MKEKILSIKWYPEKEIEKKVVLSYCFFWWQYQEILMFLIPCFLGKEEGY